MASALQERETLYAPRINEREREEKRRGEVTYRAGADRSGGEEGESKRQREIAVKIERGGVIGGRRTIGGEDEGWSLQVSCLLSSCRPGYRLRMSRDRAIRLRSTTTRENVLATTAHHLRHLSYD